MAFGFLKRIQSPYFATGSPETEESTTLYAPGMLGCLADYDTGGVVGPPNPCTYQLVKQYTAISGILGGVMYWSTKASFVVTDVATLTGQLAGISRKLVTTAATYIWILKHGTRDVRLIDSPTSAADTTGKPVVGVTATAAKADVLALATAPQPVLIGRCVGAQDGTTKLASVIVNIPDVY